jgi:tetratricopeptide (TPR) repeat protein
VRDQGRAADANRALDESGKMFEAIHQQDPHDPAAWNGLGSVAAIRGDYQTALLYINAALKIKPDYAEAAHDKAAIQRVLREQAAASKTPAQKSSSR